MDLLSHLFIFSPMKENKKFTNACIQRKEETSQIVLQTLWHLRKPEINLVGL